VAGLAFGGRAQPNRPQNFFHLAALEKGRSTAGFWFARTGANFVRGRIPVWKVIMKMREICLLALWLQAFTCVEVAGAADHSLVAGGKPQAVIVTGEDPGELVQLAASELQSYVAKISGAQLATIPGSEALKRADSETIILLGNAGSEAFVHELARFGVERPKGLKAEGYVLRTTSLKNHSAILIAGSDDAGALYGTYEFIERLGVTFRLTGDILPTNQTSLALPQLDVKMEPAMTRRGFLFPVNFDNASAFSWPDYELFLDQMARMKCNYLQFWWFAYAPWVKYGYRSETKWMGDVSAKESGYHSWVYEGFGSRTVADVTIGREHFKDRPRMAPMEMQNVQTPDEAYEVCKNLLRRIIAHAAKRNIKVWLAVELASLPPNLARHGEIVGDNPFNYVFGTFLHPQDPVNREIQVNRLKAIADTYPQAEGIFLNFAELYPDLANEKHRAFFESERPKFRELQSLSPPWSAALANLYDVRIDQIVDSNVGYFDLFTYLLKKRDEVAPGRKIGLMTVGRAYALPLFNQMLPPEIPFASLESGGVWTMQGLPMKYFGGMGARERIVQPRVDDDFDMMGMQFSVRQYAEKDRLFVDGVKYGLSGFAGQVERARGTEFNSSFLAQAAWEPGLTPKQFYQRAARQMFGAEAAPEMYQALMKLEENQAYLGYYGYDTGYGVLLCCSAIREVNAAYRYSLQKNPYVGPVVKPWKSLMTAATDFIERREGSIKLMNEALAHLQAAGPKVSPAGQYEFRYLVNRTEALRDSLTALNTIRRGMVGFDEAFKHRERLGEEAFVAQLESSLKTFQEGTGQIQGATRKFSEIIDHVSDLAVLYHLNARAVLGTELAGQMLENVVNYHRGQPYLRKVPFERLFPQRPDKGVTE
jgi:hypothetical protein